MSQVDEYGEKIEALKRRIADEKTRLTQLSTAAEIQKARTSIATGEAMLPVLEQMKRLLERLGA